MRKTLELIFPLLLGLFTLQLGSGLFGTFLAVRMVEEDFSTAAIGGVGSAYFSGFIAGALLSGIPVRRVGHIRTFAALAAVMSVSTLLFALIDIPLAWGLFRFINGLALSGLFVIVESWINERSQNRIRGQLFSIYLIASFGAIGLGQLLLPAYPISGDEHFVLVAILFAVALLPVALSIAPAPQSAMFDRLSLHELYRISPLGMLGCFACGVVYASFYSLAPVFVLASGYDSVTVSLFMGVTILAGLTLQWPLGKISDYFDRRIVVIAIAMASALLAAAFVGLGGTSRFVLLVLGAAYGGVSFTLYGLSVAHANDHLRPSYLVPASAGLLIAYGAGAIVGPGLGAAALELAGPSGLFAMISGVLVVLTGFGVHRIFMRPSVPLEEQIPYKAVPRTSPVISQLDPRSEPDNR